MKVTVIATLCHTLLGQPPVCHDEVIMERDMGIGIGCLVAEAEVIVEWKSHSIYAGENWTVLRPRCAPGGGYVIREQT
jgi:hypothetical protein